MIRVTQQESEFYIKLPTENKDKEVKKCICETPIPRPTDKNNCFECNGEIYRDYLNKIRWTQYIKI